MNYNIHTLPSGIRLIHKPEKTPAAYCGMAVNAGSRDEREEEYGMAHFVEHMLFKGTAKRRSTHIINRLENVGGDLNAFTTKEETVVYAAVLKEHLERAVELIADITLHSAFPQKEIDKELEVIMDEIESYNDSPAELIYDDFEELLFHNHALGHHILGRPELLAGYTTEDALRFVKRQYIPEQMVFFVLGDVSFKTLVRWAEKYLQPDNAGSSSAPARTAPAGCRPQQKTVVRSTHQMHTAIGGPAFDLHHPDRLAFYLLNNILGGPGMSSRLNLSLREKHGYVYNVDSMYQPFSDAGEWCVYFGCDAQHAEKCEALVYSELNKLRRNKMSDVVLRKYKLQLAGQLTIAAENRENTALSLGKNCLRYGKAGSLDSVRKKLEAVTSGQLLRIANEIFDPAQFTVLRYAPRL